MNSKSILEEAIEVTTAASGRPSEYGHPLDHFTRTTKAIDAIFRDKVKARLAAGEPMFAPEDWALMMVLDKTARAQKAHKRDNAVDIAGYANTHEMVFEERERRKPVEVRLTLQPDPKLSQALLDAEATLHDLAMSGANGPKPVYLIEHRSGTMWLGECSDKRFRWVGSSLAKQYPTRAAAEEHATVLRHNGYDFPLREAKVTEHIFG